LRLKNWTCVNVGALSEATEVNHPYLTNLTRGCLRGWVASCARGSFFEKAWIQMITLIARFRLWQ
jgi:hypothetical protein